MERKKNDAMDSRVPIGIGKQRSGEDADYNAQLSKPKEETQDMQGSEKRQDRPVE